MSRNNSKTTANKIISNPSRVPQIGKSDQKVRSTTKTATTSSSKSSSLLKNKDVNKDEEKKLSSSRSSISKTSTKITGTRTISNNTPSPSTSSVPKTKSKLTSTKLRTDLPTSRKEPVKPKHDTSTVNKIKSLKSVNTNKPNLVKDTYHSVTVASPPPIRKKLNSTEFQSLPSESEMVFGDAVPKIQQQRRGTITLDADEIIVLGKEKTEVPQNIGAYFGNTVKKKTDLNEATTTPISFKDIKEPIAFEINFEDEKIKGQGSKIAMKDDKIKVEVAAEAQPQDCVCTDEYEDDFESYESDFETGSSSAEAEEESDESNDAENSKNFKENNNHHGFHTEKDTNDRDGDDDDDDEDDEDSEETQPPITVIHRREKDTEKKLDSGSYDLKSVSHQMTTKSLELHQLIQQQQLDSLDTTTNDSDHLDSGIGTISNNNNNGIISKTYWSKGETSPIVGSIFPISIKSKRGTELMRKIKLDEISYHLFELQPMNYEYFMKIYGNLNALQASTQTNENQLSTECQTDEYQYRSMWTQHPPYFDMKSIRSVDSITSANRFSSNFIYCGEEEFLEKDHADHHFDNIQITVKALQKFKRNAMLQRNNLEFHKQKIDFEKLNQFLNRVKVTVFEVLNRNSKSVESTEITKTSFSNGYRKCNANFLNALKVTKIFAKVNFNYILTIHESTEDIYRNEFQNLIVVWNTADLQNPIRLLSSWSQVSKVDICTESSDIIVSGLNDGSIAMWDLRETYSYCSKLDGYLSHFAASQSIVPSFGGGDGGGSSSRSSSISTNETDTHLNNDLGSVVDVKSFKAETGAYSLKAYKQIQFVSLNDTGILTIWSLIEIGKQEFNPRTPPRSHRYRTNIKNEFSSPWARVKLVQSAICDLRSYLEIKNLKTRSKFEQTVLYFENDIFDDETLRELQKTNEEQNKTDELQGLRFTTLDTSSNMIYAATNRNFILACSKTLKAERFRKIYINESAFMFPTAIRLYPNEEFLLVGLSNGSVVAINCNQNKPNSIDSDDNDDNDSSKSNSESIDKNEMGKIQSSCAIQNMIRNERKLLEEIQFDQRSNSYFAEANADFRPRTAIPEFETIDGAENPWKQYKIYDQQILLNGSVLRKNLVESIEISMDGRKLYCLSDGDVKIYDFLIGSELKCSKDEDIKGICLTKADSDIGHYMVLLKSNNIVEIHKPKN